MTDKTQYRKKLSSTNLIPEQLDGYDYQYRIAQDYRNNSGLLDSNPILKATVILVEQIVDGEYPFIVFAKVDLLDDNITEESNFVDMQSSLEMAMLDAFVPQNKDLTIPLVGQRITVTYSDPHNRLGGIYLSTVKTLDIKSLKKDDQQATTKKAELFSNPQTEPKTIATLGSCKYSNKESGQVDFSNCSSEEKGEGEYELIFGDGQVAGKAKMVYADFNSRKNVLVPEMAYKSLKKMFEDAKNEGIKLRINEGFRSYEKQECYYRNYLACIDEWNKSGKKGPKPSAVADPKKSKNSSASHLNGKAADFNTGTSRTQTGLQDIFALAASKGNAAAALEETKKRLELGKINATKEWKWLVNNSEKYGWIWSGIKFREPWHFHFDEKLARKNNMI